MPSDAIHSPTPAGLFFAILWREDNKNLESIKSLIQEKWGKIISEYSPEYFPMKEYYQKEMGSPLSRIYLMVDGPHEREALLDTKVWAMEVERETSKNEKRLINIDPGLICLEQLLLISTKPYSHRVYSGNNLYTELTYQFKDKTYESLPWTYPDYVQEETIQFFVKCRKLLKNLS
ncbi:MAG: DUF4416 family protein [Bacteriovoracaceae bacterium]|nr:DUF4416 family protein [Bacteriovoracaceae bacterium]